MVGEKSVIGRGGIWPGPRSNFHESDVVSDSSHSSPLNRSETGYSSRHFGGAINMLICDGSVTSIRENIESLPIDEDHPFGGILQKLAGCADGQRVGQY